MGRKNVWADEDETRGVRHVIDTHRILAMWCTLPPSDLECFLCSTTIMAPLSREWVQGFMSPDETDPPCGSATVFAGSEHHRDLWESLTPLERQHYRELGGRVFIGTTQYELYKCLTLSEEEELRELLHRRLRPRLARIRDSTTREVMLRYILSGGSSGALNQLNSMAQECVNWLWDVQYRYFAWNGRVEWHFSNRIARVRHEIKLCFMDHGVVELSDA